MLTLKKIKDSENLSTYCNKECPQLKISKFANDVLRNAAKNFENLLIVILFFVRLRVLGTPRENLNTYDNERWLLVQFECHPP